MTPKTTKQQHDHCSKPVAGLDKKTTWLGLGKHCDEEWISSSQSALSTATPQKVRYIWLVELNVPHQQRPQRGIIERIILSYAHTILTYVTLVRFSDFILFTADLWSHTTAVPLVNLLCLSFPSTLNLLQTLTLSIPLGLASSYMLPKQLLPLQEATALQQK